MYFQSMIGAIFLLIHFFIPWEPLLLSAALIGCTVVFSLNPAFKFDGNWVVADALGIMNLSEKKWQVLAALAGKAAGRKMKNNGFSSRTLVGLQAYTLLAFTIWGFFCGLLFQR